MEIATSQESGRVPVTVLHVKGELTAENSDELPQQAQAAIEAGTRYLLLDLTEVTFLSSGGLRGVHRVFMQMEGDSAKRNGESWRKGMMAGTYRSLHLKLLNPSRSVHQVLHLAGFDMFLDIHADLQEAIASF